MRSLEAFSHFCGEIVDSLGKLNAYMPLSLHLTLTFDRNSYFRKKINLSNDIKKIKRENYYKFLSTIYAFIKLFINFYNFNSLYLCTIFE